MTFKEFGYEHKKAIILLHGGGLSWWSYNRHIKILKENYYVITPIIDGHGEDFNCTFTSISDCADKLIDYINTKHDGSVFAICGLSIGAQILVDALSKKPDLCEKAVIESALLYPLKKLKSILVPIYNLIFPLVNKKWFSKIQARSLFVPSYMFDEYYNDSIKMSKTSLINMTKSNTDFSISKGIEDTSAKALIIVGEKEISIMKKSAKLLHNTIPNSELMIVNKNGHGEFSLRTAEKYLVTLESFFNN